MLKIPHSLAWLQAVRMLYSDFYTACWYLDVFTSIMFTIILFFFMKVDCRWIRLEEACLKTGFALRPTIPQLLWISHPALDAHLWSWFWFWAVLPTVGADVPLFMGHAKCRFLALSCSYACCLYDQCRDRWQSTGISGHHWYMLVCQWKWGLEGPKGEFKFVKTLNSHKKWLFRRLYAATRETQLHARCILICCLTNSFRPGTPRTLASPLW